MVIDPKYGPQFDPSDGTVGETKLVRRYALVGKDGLAWPARQGRYTHGTREAAAKCLAGTLRNNNPDSFPELKELRVAPVWCWPGHFDPAHGAGECEEGS